MARTVQEIFDKAIHLIDAQHEQSGATTTADTLEYCVRACELLNTLLNEAYPYSDTYRHREDGRRPTYPPVRDMTDEVDMDDFVCLSILPAGLAALFVFDEDTAKYNAFWGDYQNRLVQARATLPAAFESVEDPYGGIGLGEFGHW